ncbi:MAG: PEGA domain-containing protein [Acidobacteria bacterium]|nr:PEGA domain-containing protein [Acidobacteriota bacterium]
MKRTFLILLALVGCAAICVAQTPWQYARIVDVRKSVETKTKAWVVNTPITEDLITYTISVQAQDKIIMGTYELTPEESAPPEEWTTNYPVKIQIAADRLFVRGPTGEIRLHITRRKAGKIMTPLTADEKKQLEQIEAPAGSMVGFSTEKTAGAAAPPAENTPPPEPVALPPTTGVVTVRSTPYLSEVFVDGDSMGYTPAKVSLPPGKHSFRVEKAGYKPWTKEIAITVGSELTLDANLEKK